MRQFDVFANPSHATNSYAPFVVVLQSHYLDPLDTVVVAPLVRDANPVLSPLDIPLKFQGEALAIAIAELSHIDRKRMTRSLGNLAEYRDEISRALDRLLTGF